METVLLVDDDPAVLEVNRRLLNATYEIATADSAEAAVALLNAGLRPAVILTDQRMPGMPGTELLAAASELSPRSVRMLITAFADLDAAVEAINAGRVFQFLTKPCPSAILKTALVRGMRQFHLQNAERELLEGTLSGSIKLLTDVLAVASPQSFGHAARVSRLARELSGRVDEDSAWLCGMAAMLSLIGCIALPEELVRRALSGAALSPQEQADFESQRETGSRLVGNIPRLDGVARVIEFQRARFDGVGGTHPGIAGDAIPLGARVLQAAADYDLLTFSGKTPLKSLALLHGRTGQYDPVVLAALTRFIQDELGSAVAHLKLSEVMAGMIMAEDVMNPGGVMLVGRGQEVSPALQSRLRSLDCSFPSDKLFKVIIPTSRPASPA